MPLANARLFAERLADLAVFHGKELDSETVRTYWEALSPRLDDDTFASACETLKTGDWWPTPARILRAAAVAAEFASREAVARLFDRIRACDEPGPTGGSCYRYTTVRQRCGQVGERLFWAVGGPSTFLRALRHPDDEVFLRKEFAEAARDLARSEPAAMRELMASVLGSLPAGARTALRAPEGAARASA